MNKICGIYKITSPSGKIYIGQSKNINNRLLFYKNYLCKKQTKLYNSLLKYGWENHKFEIIEECSVLLLNEREEFYINYYNTFNTEHGLNLTSGGNFIKLSITTKQKISKSLKGIKRSKLTKEKISNARKGLKLSTTTKEKIGNSKKGNKYSVGRIVKTSTKNKISDKNSGTYEIYDNNHNLKYKFKGNIKLKLKEFGLPRNSLCNTYRHNKSIKQGKHAGWYMIKLY